MEKYIFTVLLLLSTSVEAKYRIQVLGDFEENNLIANAINNYGDVAGEEITENRFIQSFIYYSDPEINRLGALDSFYSFSESINDVGDVVGYTHIPNDERAFMFNEESGMTLLEMPQGYSFSIAKAINDNGQIVGEIGKSSGSVKSFIYDQDSGFSILDEHTEAGSSAEDINANGTVVGTYFSPIAEAFIYDETGGFKTLGTLGGATSRAYSINSKSQVVGESQNSLGNAVAFLYDENKGITELGTLGGPSSKALAINAIGQIVGTSQNSFGENHAFLYENGKMFPLMDLVSINSSGWTSLLNANDINDKGQITGNGYFNGKQKAFLLTPVYEAIPVIVTENLDIHLHSTIFQSATGDQAIWANLDFDGVDEFGDYYWRINSFGEESIQPETFAFVSSNLDIQIQTAITRLESGEQKLWANLIFVGSVKDNNFVWKLADFEVVPEN